ncbi:MAG: glycosyltransferase, partial [Candidatus Angelobacter sp.]
MALESARRTIAEMLIAAGVLSCFIWAYLVLARGGFWRIHPVAPPEQSLGNSNPVRIAVIIPARNEADVVGRAIQSLLQQSGPNTLHIFLVDDGSTDGTAQAARAASMSAGQAQNLTILLGSPLPPGWSGKLWAMQQGIEQAGKTAP